MKISAIEYAFRNLANIKTNLGVQHALQTHT